MTKLEKMLAEHWQDLAYCLAITERMAPNYALFHELTEFGDVAVINNALDLMWSCVAGHEQVINFEKQLEKIEVITPDLAAYDFFGVRPALDTCVAVTQLLDICALHEAVQKETFDTINQSTIEAYLDVIDYQGEHAEHSLSVDSRAFALEISHVLDNESKKRLERVNALKSLVRSLSVSNIGISL